MAKGRGMGPGSNPDRPIDHTSLGSRGAGAGDDKSFSKPAGYPTAKGESKEGRSESGHAGKGEREARIPAGGKHEGKSSGSSSAHWDAPLHDMSSHLGHHSAGSSHKDVWSGGGKTK
jgi:hypothetical protein